MRNALVVFADSRQLVRKNRTVGFLIGLRASPADVLRRRWSERWLETRTFCFSTLKLTGAKHQKTAQDMSNYTLMQKG